MPDQTISLTPEGFEAFLPGRVRQKRHRTRGPRTTVPIVADIGSATMAMHIEYGLLIAAANLATTSGFR